MDWQHVDDYKQQEKEAASKVTQVVETVGADLSRCNAEPTVNGKGVAAAVEVRRCEDQRDKPRDCNKFPHARLAVDHHRTERVDDSVVSTACTNIPRVPSVNASRYRSLSLVISNQHDYG